MFPVSLLLIVIHDILTLALVIHETSVRGLSYLADAVRVTVEPHISSNRARSAVHDQSIMT